MTLRERMQIFAVLALAAGSLVTLTAQQAAASGCSGAPTSAVHLIHRSESTAHVFGPLD